MNKFFDIKNIISDNTEFVGRLHSHTDGIISFKATYEITLTNASVVTKDYTEITGYSNGQIGFDLDDDISSVKAIEKVVNTSDINSIEELSQYVTMAINSAKTINNEAFLIVTDSLKKREDYTVNDQTFYRMNWLIPSLDFPDDTGKPDIVQPTIPLTDLTTIGLAPTSKGLVDAVIELGTQGSFQDKFTARIVPLWIKLLFERGYRSGQIKQEIGLQKFWYVSGTVEPIEVTVFEIIYYNGKVYLHWWTGASFRQVNIPAVPIIAKEITKTTTLTTTPEHKLLSEFLIAHKDGANLTFGDVLSSDNINLPIDFQHAQDLVNDDGTHLISEFKIDTKKLQTVRTFLKGKKDKIVLPFTGNGVINIKVSIESDQLFPFAESPETRLDVNSSANVQNIIIDMLNTEDVDFSHLVGDHMLVRVYAYKYKGSGSVEIVQNPTAGHHIKLSRINE